MKKKVKKVLRELEQYLGIILGAFFYAIGYTWFLVPYKISPGGVGGIAQIFFHLNGFPVGIFMVLANIPLFLLSVLLLGKSFGAKSFYGMLVTSILIDLVSIPNFHKLGIFADLSKYTFTVDGEQIYAMFGPNELLLSAIAGSVLLGIGLGLIFRFRGSTGGTDIPVAIIKEKTGLSIGTGYWIVETLIILTVGIVFHDAKLVLWGYINLFITSKITDLTSEGLPYVKGVYIISDHSNDIKEEIFNRLDRGVTLFKAERGYTGIPTDVVFCALNRRQVPELVDIVKDIDAKSFVTVTDVYDVMGRGFRSRNLTLTDKSLKAKRFSRRKH